MKEKIFKNFSLKLLSAVFAVVLWTVIVNIYSVNISNNKMAYEDNRP